MSEKINESLPIDKKIFREYFQSNGWTYDSYDSYNYKKATLHTDIRKNSIGPNSRDIRRYLSNGRIPLRSAIGLCQVLNAKPDKLGIDVKA